LYPKELKQYANRKIFVALIAIITLVAVSTGAAIFSISELLLSRQASQDIDTSHSQLEDLLVELEQAESGQRGYLLTGQDSYLAPYHVSIAQIPKQLSALESGSRNVSYHAGIMALSQTVHQKLAELAKTIQLQDSGNPAAAIGLVQTDMGQQAMEHLRGQVSAIEAEQNSQISSGRDRITMFGMLARDISIVTLVLTLILAALVYYEFLRAIQAEHELDRAKDEFVSLASHQLRTPATGIKSILSTLVSGDFGPLNPRQLHFVKKAIESNDRELSIVEELLNVARVDAGRLVLHPAEVDIVCLIISVVAEQRPAIEDKHITLDIKQPNHPVLLSADEEKLYMAIGNLLDNARKYTPESGTIKLKTRAGRESVVVEITDSGIGINEDELEHIFDRFQRAGTAMSGNVEGTGLGLYLARSIAELHQGTIEVTSTPGRGSQFTMTLPTGGG
jgi:signal transduction histidine kinase